MRRILPSIGGVALAASLLVTPAPATAAPAQRISDTETTLFCELASEAGTVFTFAAESEAFGSFGDLAFWSPSSSPQTSNPTWISVMADVNFDADSVTATYELVEFSFGSNPEDPPFGDPVGSANLEATLAPLGEPQEYRINEKFGNQVFRREGTVQELSVTGTLDLPTGISFDLTSCFAGVDTYTSFSNAPASSVARFSQFSLSCGWEVDGAFVGLFAFADEFGAFSDLFVFGENVELFGVPTSPPTFTTEEYTASFDLFDGFDPDAVDPVGGAEASAILSEAGRINERFSFGNTKVHITGTSYAVDGTLSLTIADSTYQLPMDGESCFAADQRITEHTSARQGPKGKPLPNDAPDGALPIGIGEEVTVKTGGTALEPEAPCIGEFDGEEVEFPIGKTAWWTFEGTGGDVTIDTAGSDFDTIVGVYADDGGALTPIGCVDDVDSLQARIAVPTEAGVTYWIQAGGFGGASGTLVLTLN
jgi:hypothetical protein